MKCEVILAREGGYEFYTNVKCRPYPLPYYCVTVTRTPRWASDYIYPGLLRVYDSFKVEEEHEKKYPQYKRRIEYKQPLPVQSIVFRMPGLHRRPKKEGLYVPMRDGDGKSKRGHFYAVRIPVKKGFDATQLEKYNEEGVEIALKECEFGKYIEIEKPFDLDFEPTKMRESVNRIATKLRLQYNLFDLLVTSYRFLKIAILGEIKETKRIL